MLQDEAIELFCEKINKVVPRGGGTFSARLVKSRRSVIARLAKRGGIKVELPIKVAWFEGKDFLDVENMTIRIADALCNKRHERILKRREEAEEEERRRRGPELF